MDTTTNITTNTDGSLVITTVTRMRHFEHYPALMLAALAAVLIASGLYLLMRKEK